VGGYFDCFDLNFAQRARCAAAILARAAAESLRRGLRPRFAEALLRPAPLPPMWSSALIACSRRSSSC